MQSERMADITQITAVYRLDFSANTPLAEAWMKNHYGDREIFFDLPHDESNALAFIAAAKAQGFSIETD
jgi:hypothetical protein